MKMADLSPPRPSLPPDDTDEDTPSGKQLSLYWLTPNREQEEQGAFTAQPRETDNSSTPNFFPIEVQATIPLTATK